MIGRAAKIAKPANIQAIVVATDDIAGVKILRLLGEIEVTAFEQQDPLFASRELTRDRDPGDTAAATQTSKREVASPLAMNSLNPISM